MLYVSGISSNAIAIYATRKATRSRCFQTPPTTPGALTTVLTRVKFLPGYAASFQEAALSNAGLFFTLTALELARLNGLDTPEARRTWVDETYSERQIAMPARMLDVDLAWDAIHRCLGDGSLEEDTGQYPLRLAVLGGKRIGTDPGLIIRLKTPDEVQMVANMAGGISHDIFRKCYFALPVQDFLIAPNEADFQYSWTHFQQMQRFYENAAQSGEYVVFTAYQ